MNKYLLTRSEYNKLVKRLSRLEQNQKSLIEAQICAMSEGDERECDAWSLAREHSKYNSQSQKELYLIIHNCEILEDNYLHMKDMCIEVGSKVQMLYHGKLQVYLICSSIESDPFSNKISIESPLGKAIFGRKENDIIEFNNDTIKILRVLSIKKHL